MKNHQQQTIALILLTSILSLNTLFSQKQIPQSQTHSTDQNPEEMLSDCAHATAQADLDVNNVSARLLVGGDLWHDQDGGKYNVPKPTPGGPAVSAIFSGGLWLGGFDQGHNLKLAAQTYGSFNGSADYWPGPLDDIGISTYEVCPNYDRFWETTSGAINTHIADWNDNGIINGPVPNSVLGWPGKDNSSFFAVNGFYLPPLREMAPFVDRNNNGVYEPLAGDYPDIHNADQGIWWIFNDASNIHTQSLGSPLQFEIHALAYAYISTNENINNATFYDYKFINRAAESLDSAYVGLWVDFDLGCFLDDYVGCIPGENLAYVYNGDALDGLSNCNDCQGMNTYCEDIPLVGLKVLEGVKALENGQIIDRKMSSFQHYYSSGTNPPLGTGDPNSPHQYYNLMTGSWVDGTRLTEGGHGYNPASIDYTNYAFPDPPNDPNGWSACTANLPPTDTRAVIGSGPYSIEPGGVNSICFAVIYASDVAHPCPSIDPLIEAGNDVQDFYEDIVGTTEVLAQSPANIQFQPNPMTDQAELIFKDLENQVKQVGVFALDGRQVQTYNDINGSTLTIQRKSLSPGIYFYKLLTEDFKIHSGKFIVQ